MSKSSSGFARAMHEAKMRDILNNEEAKATARQVRACLFRCIEHAIDNEWKDVMDGADSVKVLAEHLRKIEGSYT